MVLSHLEDATAVATIASEPSLVVVQAAATVTTTTATVDRADRGDDALAVPQVLVPLANVSLLAVLAEELASAVAHIVDPVADVEAVVVEEALAVATLPHSVMPRAVILVAVRLLSVRGDEASVAFALLSLIQPALVHIAVLVCDVHLVYWVRVYCQQWLLERAYGSISVIRLRKDHSLSRRLQFCLLEDVDITTWLAMF